MPFRPGATHDLVRLLDPTALQADSPAPSWLASALARAPRVVIRRGQIRDGMIPVGVRGSERNQRFAAFLSTADVHQRLSPEDVLHMYLATEHERSQAVSAVAALGRVAPLLANRRERWGPVGSVGFEIASGIPTATSSSDLDLILRREHRIEPDEAVDLLAALEKAAAPTRIDVMVETPIGGVSLADLATRPTRLLVRTLDGPRLLVDPWHVDATASVEVVS